MSEKVTEKGGQEGRAPFIMYTASQRRAKLCKSVRA